ncbi:hypothetical protein TNCV_4885131 [Trichonephila clavipes]|nr:hypothetical protein TNCV_4885131 [Trichonephila clavipes]
MGAGSEEVTLILENQGGRDNSYPLSLICDVAIKNVHLFVRLDVSKLFTQLNERGVLSEEFFQFDDSVHEPEGSAIIAFNFFLVSFSFGGLELSRALSRPTQAVQFVVPSGGFLLRHLRRRYHFLFLIDRD